MAWIGWHNRFVMYSIQKRYDPSKYKRIRTVSMIRTVRAFGQNALFLLYRKFLLNHELCKQIALQKQGTENRRLRLEDIKTFFSKIVIVDIIKFM